MAKFILEDHLEELSAQMTVPQRLMRVLIIDDIIIAIKAMATILQVWPDLTVKILITTTMPDEIDPDIDIILLDEYFGRGNVLTGTDIQKRLASEKHKAIIVSTSGSIETPWAKKDNLWFELKTKVGQAKFFAEYFIDFMNRVIELAQAQKPH